jgi:hypothetical protein
VGARAWGQGLLGVFARSDWRAHWRAHLLIAATLAATVGIVVATLNGADRSRTAFDRLRAETHAADLSVSDIADVKPYGVADDLNAAAARLARVDGVEATAGEVELFTVPKDSGLIPTFDLHPLAPSSAATSPVNTPVVRHGRAIDPSRADEVALNEDLASRLHVGVGDALTLQSATQAWIDKAFSAQDPGPPDGPEVEVRVVGIVRSPVDFGPTPAVLHLSPAFLDRYGDRMRVDHFVQVQLTPAALRRFELRDEQPGFGSGTFVQPSAYSSVALSSDGLDALATALRLLAAAAALAGLVATALAILRQSRVVLRDRATLVAIGSTRRQLVGATALVFLPWLVLGVGAGLALGIAASPLALIGLARRADPHPSAVTVDGMAVLVIAAVTVLVIGVVVVAAAVRAASAVRSASSRSARGLQLRRPVPGALGLRWALFGEPDRGGRTSRGALAACVVGVITGVAALTVSSSIARLQTDPRLTGPGGGRYIDSGEGTDVYDQALPLLEADPRVTMLVGYHKTEISLAGELVTTRIHDIRRGDIDSSVLRGRDARQADEVALGPKTLDRLHKHVGDTVELEGKLGSGRFRIVGAVVFPEGDWRPFDNGISLTADGAGRIVGDAEAAGDVHGLAFDWADGVDAAAADEALADEGLPVMPTQVALLPAAASSLGQVEGLPRFLALFVGLLALVTLGHALAVNVRLRSRELGTLRALGMTPRATTAAVGTQALALIAIALLAGMPLGFVAARAVWTAIAGRAHLVVLTVSPWSWIVVLVMAMVAATLVMSLLPAWRALRLRPAETLRTE